MTEPIKQYYFRAASCKAESSTDADCICWHDVGTGPRPSSDLGLTWRLKPIFSRLVLADAAIVGEEKKSVGEKMTLEIKIADLDKVKQIVADTQKAYEALLAADEFFKSLKMWSGGRTHKKITAAIEQLKANHGN